MKEDKSHLYYRRSVWNFNRLANFTNWAKKFKVIRPGVFLLFYHKLSKSRVSRLLLQSNEKGKVVQREHLSISMLGGTSYPLEMQLCILSM